MRARFNVEELEVRVVPTLLGQQLFPADYPWNQDISSAPVAANSAAIISHIGSSVKVHPDWGEDNPANGSSPLYSVPVNVVHGNSASVAKVNVIIDNYPNESNLVAVPMPNNIVIEGDYQNGPNLNGGGYKNGQRGDSHMIVWDEDNNIAYEFYGATRPADPTLFPNTSGVELTHTDGQWHAAQESVWDMKTDTFRTLGYTSADAAGLSMLAGLARPDEGLPANQGGQGAINHALRVTLPSGDIAPQYIYPASHVVSVSAGSTNLPFGARLRLMNTPAVNAVISTLGPEAQIIAKTMQQYGLEVADIGGSMFVSGTAASVDANNAISLTWDMNDVLGLRALTAADFEVVDLTPRVTGLSSSSGTGGSTITITGQNLSGAAGHLSVLFGGTASTKVTYVDDAHLSAVVPSGTGTVHVTVQSGVIETDPNNPKDNVTAPVFGYGTSATSAAEQFTYINQTISGTNSTDSFATATDTSGIADTLTIVVKDTTGAVVSGLPNGAFKFALAGGTSAGTFGAVIETATAGTYTTSFTGTTAGTASTLTTTVNGVTLTTTPIITVTTGAVSGSTSTVSFATSTVTSGSTDTITIAVKDGASNVVSGLLNSAFSFVLSAGASGGTFGAVTETATQGTYTATFTGTTAGAASKLTTTINSATLTARPTVSVTPGAVSGAVSSVSFAAPAVASGGTDIVNIVVADSAGNAISGLANSAFNFALSGGTSAGTFGTVTESTVKGTYTTSFTGTTLGKASTLTTTVSGVTLATKPTITVVTVGPSGTIATNVPVFTWTAVTGGASYKIWLTDDTTGQVVVVPNLSGTSWTPTQPLILGDRYTWWAGSVQGQTTTWSTGLDFRIAPTGHGPSGTIATNVPSFTWNTVTGATSYEVWLTDQTTGQVEMVPNVTGTSWTPTPPLTLGDNYTWWIGAVNGQSIGWDSALTFLIAPTGSGPSGTIATNLPTFAWNSVTGAASYKIWLSDQTSGQVLVVPNLAGTSWTPTQPLTLGDNYTWWVAAVQGQVTAWDGALSFRVAPTGSSPSGTITSTMPAFSWNTVTGAVSYEIWLTDRTMGKVLVVPNLIGTSWTPTQALAKGDNYSWWVGAVSASGMIGWDDALSFTISG
jgi:hypothetical protein